MAEKYGAKVRELMVKEMRGIISDKKGFVLAGLEKTKAVDMDVFRKKMRQSGSQYLVAKNKLIDIALKEEGISGLGSMANEKKMMGIGVIENDPVSIAKIIMEFAKTNKNFTVSGGYLEGNVLTADRIKELAELPGREQLIAMVLGTMNAPITSFVGVMASVLRSIMHVLNAIKEKKEGSN